MSPSRPSPGRFRAGFHRRFCLVACGLVLVASSAQGQDQPGSDMQQLRQALDAERKARQADREEFERRVAALEKARSREILGQEVEDYLTERDLFRPTESASTPGAGKLLQVSVILDASLGGSSAPDRLIQTINVGDHDPRQRGFNVRNEEIVFSADVDPYFYAVIDVVYKITEDGESELELEEAYAQTTSLPGDLQLKIGQFFTEFGRLNPTHPHTWEFVTLPVIHGRIFGPEGWRGQGLRVSWMAPWTETPIRILGGVQNARGETQLSFLGEEGALIGGHEFVGQPFTGLDSLAYHVRVEVSRDLRMAESTMTTLLGFSFASGPNGTGRGATTRIYGVDFFLKWRPDATEAGWPFVMWQTEFLHRDFDASGQVRAVDNGMGGTTMLSVPARTFRDWGLYTQVVYGFHRSWTAGVRYEFADSDGAFAGSHHRVAAALTYYPSEFSRIRFEVNYDRTVGDEIVSFWLSLGFSLGKHGAHRF